MMRKIKLKNSGFTLVEILVVLAVLSIVGVLVLTIFSRSLRGNNKSQIIVALKQSGQNSLEMMDRGIRNADNLVCVSKEISANPAVGNTAVIVKNGVYTRYRFVIPPNDSFSGLIRQDNPIPANIEEDNPVVFVRRVCNPEDPMASESLVLTDTNTQSGVSLANGTFTRSQLSGFKDSVTIKFVLIPAPQTPKAIANEIDPVSFETTIQLR